MKYGILPKDKVVVVMDFEDWAEIRGYSSLDEMMERGDAESGQDAINLDLLELGADPLPAGFYRTSMDWWRD